MALQLPGYTALPVSRSSLEGLLEQFDEGRRLRADENAFDAAASAFGGQGGQSGQIVQQPSVLERLMGFANSSQPLPANGLPTNTMRMGGNDIVSQSHTAAASATDPALTDYFANARTAESGGNDSAKNPNSTALGRYQFLDSTWRGLMEQYPELGLTADGRTDPAQQERAMARFTQDNARTLAGAGLPVNPGTLYAAHFLGAGGASNVLGQDPASPLSAYVSQDVIAANPNLQGMTVGDFTAWANEKGGGGGNGGYTPPMRNEGQVPGARQFTPDADTMRTLLASEATRPLAFSLIQAQQQADASRGRYVVEEGPDGAIWQRDTLTGEQSILQQAPAAAERRIIQGPDGNSYYEDGSRVLPGVEAPVPAPDFGDTSKLRTEIQGLPSYKNLAQAAPIYHAMSETAGRDTRASDLNLVYGLGKIMDPTSVVREGEMFMVQGINTLPDKLIEGVNSLLTGSSTLSPETRQAILTEAYGRMKGYEDQFKSDVTQYQGIVERNRLNPADVIPSFGEIVPWEPASAGPPAITTEEEYNALPPGMQYRDPTGQIRTKG